MTDITFQCNLCGHESTLPVKEMHREAGNCRHCGSNIRFRALIHALSTRLYGKPMVMKDFPPSRHMKGIGISDAPHYAAPLAGAYDYTNYQYHTRPRLDIMNIPSELEASADFITSSDVFEHVAPPRFLAFENSFRLLKPGGILVLTVPYIQLPKTVEYYPHLHNFRFIDHEGRKVLVNRRKDGKIEAFDQLFWHGGEGSTLEMRVFGTEDVMQLLASAGFTDIEVFSEDDLHFGIIQKRQGGAYVITARRPAQPLPKPAYREEDFTYPASERVKHPLVNYPRRLEDFPLHVARKAWGFGAATRALKKEWSGRLRRAAGRLKRAMM